MKVEQIVISMERKHNLGNYENVTFFSSITVTVEAGDSLGEVYAEARRNIHADIDLSFEFFLKAEREKQEKKLLEVQKTAAKIMQEAEQE